MLHKLDNHPPLILIGRFFKTLNMKKILIAIMVISLAGCTKEKVCSKAVAVGDAPPPYDRGWTRVMLENGDTLHMKGEFEKGEIICYKR